MTIHVKAKHIKAGKKNEPKDCAVALAIRAMGFKNVDVDAAYIYTAKDVYKTSNVLAKFIYNFDYGKLVKPRKFRVTKV